MALSSASAISIKTLKIPSSSTFSRVRIPYTKPLFGRPRIVCNFGKQNESNKEFKNWNVLISTTLATAVIILSCIGGGTMPALADLNKFEDDTGGEFGIGSADLIKAVHVNANFRGANFTSADMRENLISVVVHSMAHILRRLSLLRQTFLVLNEANLTNVVLARSVLTRSDLAGAGIEGADFSDAVLDLPKKFVVLVSGGMVIYVSFNRQFTLN